MKKIITIFALAALCMPCIAYTYQPDTKCQDFLDSLNLSDSKLNKINSVKAKNRKIAATKIGPKIFLKNINFA